MVAGVELWCRNSVRVWVEMGSSRPGYEVRKIYNMDVFQRILCEQEMDISVMYGNITCQKSEPITANK